MFVCLFVCFTGDRRGGLRNKVASKNLSYPAHQDNMKTLDTTGKFPPILLLALQRSQESSQDGHAVSGESIGQ